MQTVFFFKNMQPDEEKAMRDYFSIKIPSLARLTTHFPDDGATLQMKGEKFDKHSAYDVELTLKLPTETLVAREASHLITKAVDLAKDRLMMQLKKQLEQLRRGHRSIKTQSKQMIRVAQTA